MDYKTVVGLKTTRYDYAYYSGGFKNNMLQTESSGSLYSSYDYDNLGRIISVKRKTGIPTGVGATNSNGELEYRYTYNTLSQQTSITYPGGVIVNQTFDNNGFETNIKLGSQNIWTLNTKTANQTAFTLGNNVTTSQSYNTNGYLTDIATKMGTTDIQKLHYTYNEARGLMMSRADQRTGYNQYESFSYDNLDRLTGNNVGLSNPVAHNIGYATTDGSNSYAIQQKSQVGIYNYNANKPGQINSIKPDASVTPDDYKNFKNHTLIYNDEGMVTSITQANSESDATDKTELFITYGIGGQRVKTELKVKGSTIRTIYYGGMYEVYVDAAGNAKQLFYINAPTGLTAVVQRTPGGDAINYIHTDHLGSIVAITDNSGIVKEEYNYDPWGRNRNVKNWNEFITTNAKGLFVRGFTGHEHIPELGLINMNGRFYDPQLGVFISVDPLLQEPYNIQNYNKYTYCLNNPLGNIDPSGNGFFAVFFAALASVTFAPLSMVMAVITGENVIDAYNQTVSDFWDGGMGFDKVFGPSNSSSGSNSFDEVSIGGKHWEYSQIYRHKKGDSDIVPGFPSGDLLPQANSNICFTVGMEYLSEFYMNSPLAIVDHGRYSFNKSYNELFPGEDITKNGVSSKENAEKFISEYFSINSISSNDDIIKSLDNGNPVMSNIMIGVSYEKGLLNPTRNYHNVVIIGYNMKDQTFIVADPATGTWRRVPMALFNTGDKNMYSFEVTGMK